ncbi:S24 family peptidase [Pseudomonas mosselii]|uniref:S24 family peptidase n=1 Tax=Pseudomonas mosselii TaxID=78327 RepID=UPI003D2905B7
MEIKDIRRHRLHKLLLTMFKGRKSSLAEAIDKPASYVSRLFSDNPSHARNIGESMAREIEHSLGLTPGYLDTPLTKLEIGGAWDPATNPDLTSSEELSIPVRLAQKIERYNGHVDIPVMDVEASMGPGRYPPETEVIASRMTLEVEWLRRTVAMTDISNLRVITGMGESMSPTIRHGDLLLIDTGVDSVTYDAVYLIAMSTALLVKRIQRELDGIRIVSDNPKYKEIVVPGDMEERIQILGRVVFVWSGNRV